MHYIRKEGKCQQKGNQTGYDRKIYFFYSKSEFSSIFLMIGRKSGPGQRRTPACWVCSYVLFVANYSRYRYNKGYPNSAGP